MQIFVKTLKGTHFDIEVKPEDTVADVKNSIEISKGKNVYPADQQMLIHQGKVLKDETTLAENNVTERNFIVIMLRKAKGSSSGASTPSTVPASQAKGSSSGASTPSTVPASQPPTASSAPANPSMPAPTPAPAPASIVDAYGQVASNLVAGNNLDQAIQHILDIGGGSWDMGSVVKAMRAAFNNPERAIEYLYSGIPEQAEVPPDVQSPTGEREAADTPVPLVQPPQPVQSAVPSTGPNANPLDLFPQGSPNIRSNASTGRLDFLRNIPQFLALKAMVQANPHILQPMLVELGKQNPQIMRLIQEHQAEFLNLIYDPSEGGENNLLDQLAPAMPESVSVSPEEHEAIERLEAMGFDRSLVLEVFFLCNKDEELAANYLLDHMHEFEEEDY